jgi:hypothetical protein
MGLRHTRAHARPCDDRPSPCAASTGPIRTGRAPVTHAPAVHPPASALGSEWTLATSPAPSPNHLAELIEALDLRDVVPVGHSTGGGEVTRYVGREERDP